MANFLVDTQDSLFLKRVIIYVAGLVPCSTRGGNTYMCVIRFLFFVVKAFAIPAFRQRIPTMSTTAPSGIWLHRAAVGNIPSTTTRGLWLSLDIVPCQAPCAFDVNVS